MAEESYQHFINIWMFLIYCIIIQSALLLHEVHCKDCKENPKTGKCPISPEFPFANEKCSNDSECPGNMLCCKSSTGEKFCSFPRDSKSGICPSNTSKVHIDKTCLLDSDCDGENKCCQSNDCQYYCYDIINEEENRKLSPENSFVEYPGETNISVIPILFEERANSPDCFRIPKYGICPYKLINPLNSVCLMNEDCPGNKICCSDGGGTKKCTDPATSRTGNCPSPGSLLNKGQSMCYVDENCGSDRKCCEETPCSYFCSDISKTNIIVSPLNPSCYSIPKYGSCPSTLVNPGVYPCFNDENCSKNRKCCPDGTGRTRCSDPLQTRPGKCPLPEQLVNRGINPCYVDENCGNDRRCCESTPCSYFCSDVIPGSIITTPPPCYSVPKFGGCPINITKKGSSPCFGDVNCSGNRLCCLDSQSGLRYCSDPDRSLEGNCPPPGSLLNSYRNSCFIDEMCTDGQFCCQETPCSYFCSNKIA